MTEYQGWPRSAATPPVALNPNAVPKFEALVDDVIAGRLEVWNLPYPLADLYWLGWGDGRDTLRPDLDAANSEADRLWAVAFTDKKPHQLVGELIAHERAIAYRNRHKGAAA